MQTEKTLPVLKPYLSALVVFFVLRVAFLIYHISLFSQISALDISCAFLNGLMIDSSVAASTLFLVRMITLLIQIVSKNTARRVHTILLYFSFGLYFFINLGDIVYFEMFDSRFNILFLENLEQIGPIILTVLADFPVLTVSAATALAIVCFAWLNRLQSRFKSFRFVDCYKKSASIVTLLLMVGLSFLWTGEPFWRMSAFSVGNQALNQLSLNGVYTLTKAVDQKRILKRDSGGISYEYVLDEQAIQSTRARIIGENEQFVSEVFPMARKITRPKPLSVLKPNIIIVLMEGFSASYIGALNPGRSGCSPGFDSLAREGILFTNFYGHETRTHHGLVSTVGSFPSLLGLFLTRRRGTESFYTLGTLLKQYGYSTSFIYGFDQGFDHMGFFMKQGGFDRIIDRTDFPDPFFEAEWGVSDEDLFDKSHEFFAQMPEDAPFFSVLLTSSNHSPHEVPERFLEKYPEYVNDKLRAAFAYSDYALKRFIEKTRKEPYFKKTIFVILADHGEIRDSKDRYFKRFHIPCLIYSPHLMEEPRVIATVSGQVDIATTLMHLIGYPYPFHFIGRDLLTLSPDDGFAVMRNNYNLYYRVGKSVLVRDIRDTLSTIYAVDSLLRMKVTDEIKDDALRSRMNRDLEDYLQTINYLFSTGKHRTGEVIIE